VVPTRGTVLDVACGAGYGTALIARAHPNLTVVGVDYDKRAIDYAIANYSAPNLTFAHGNLVDWTFSDGAAMGRYDCVISFDTIEHILHREIALINIAENLREHGCLLLSTPSGHAVPVLNPAWEHHKIEYSASYLYNFMRRFFRIVKTADDGSLPNLAFWNELNVSETIYWNRMNPLACYDPLQFGL
jgi:2-polyprenyl-3-methyl-5-hydroxy-6-metoxy-1,4-benzoquinol methylase